jgi:hypothetical protein
MYGRLRRTPEPTSDAEWKVIKVFFSIFFTIVLLVIAWMWYSRSQECEASCIAQGFEDGSLRLKGGSRINSGSTCECAGQGRESFTGR